MMNYTKAATLDLSRSASEVYDVLSDIKNDVHGLVYTLAAIAEQPSVIEPEQISTLSDMVFFIDGALCAVLEHMRGEPITAPEHGGAQEPTAARHDEGVA